MKMEAGVRGYSRVSGYPGLSPNEYVSEYT